MYIYIYISLCIYIYILSYICQQSSFILTLKYCNLVRSGFDFSQKNRIEFLNKAKMVWL